jgi:hypothetical protein
LDERKLISWVLLAFLCASTVSSVFYLQRMGLLESLDGASQLQGVAAVYGFDFWAPLVTLFGVLFLLSCRTSVKVEKRIAMLVLALSSVILGLTLALDYAGNTTVTPVTSIFMSTFFSTSSHAVNDVAAALLLPIGVRLSSFSDAFFWFVLLLVSFFKLRALATSWKSALLNTISFGLGILALFSLGICVIDPIWAFGPVTTHWQDGTAIQFFSNFDLLVASSLSSAAFFLVGFSKGSRSK